MTAPPFDLIGPLPTGRVAIEASAGTGKTFALAGLTARYVIEAGTPIGEILIVTFTKAAAAELRDRIRARLTEAADALLHPPANPDALLTHLCVTDQEVRLARARTALADFDSATITTIHSFAQQVLATLGSASPSDPDATLDEAASGAVRSACNDVLVAEALAGHHTGSDLPGLPQLTAAVAKVGGNAGIAVVPPANPDASSEPAALRRRLVDLAIERSRQQRRLAGRLSFDDVLTELRAAVRHPTTGISTCALMRGRYRVVLVDEFQDTDPVQWDIFDTAFGDPDTGTTLVLVGDPKQSIYAFRGADLHAYLAATQDPRTVRATLGTNWRSDGVLLAALADFFDGATFGDRRITFHPVAPSPSHEHERIHGPHGTEVAPLRLRLAAHPNIKRTKRGPRVASEEAADAIFADLAQVARELLDGATIPGHAGPQRVEPAHLTVLTLTHVDGPKIRRALNAVGIPAVITKGDSVARSRAATQWQWLLEAIAMPGHVAKARTAAISWFGGWTADALAEANDDDLARVHEQIHAWAQILATSGTASFLRAVRNESGVAARVLASPDGERDLTDLDHIAELLALTAGGATSGSAVLAAFAALASMPVDEENEFVARRVESEAAAVQIMTVFASKGLEFPIVLLPTLWRSRASKGKRPSDPTATYHDPRTDRRTVDVAHDTQWSAPDEPDAREREEWADRDAQGQHLRLLYVALTRAKHQTVLWHATIDGNDGTAPTRLLYGRSSDGRIDPTAYGELTLTPPADDDAADTLAPLIVRANGLIDVEVIGPAPDRPERWTGMAIPVPAELTRNQLPKAPDRHSRRWSFSGITAGHRDHTIDPFDPSLGDAGSADEADPYSPAPLISTDPTTGDRPEALPFTGIPGGADFGNLVHTVLEHTDFTVPDLPGALSVALAEARAEWGVTVDPVALVRALVASIDTPLGPLFNQHSLRALAPSNRLDELDFALLLRPDARPITDADVGRCVADHLPSDHSLLPWATDLAAGRFDAVLAGMLVGSIDLVARVAGSDGSPDRFVVADYKTNMLGPRGVPLSIDAYRPSMLPQAMAHNHYVLQALLYSVALHRYLRSRLPTYDPEHNLGGIAYLFLRGMVGPATPTDAHGVPCGVFSWLPPPGLITDLSDLLDGGAP